MKYFIFLLPLGLCLFLAYNGKSCSKGCHGCGKCMNFSLHKRETGEKDEKQGTL